MIKKILLSFLILTGLIISVGFLLPDKIQIVKSIAINAPSGYVFEEINELERWKDWSYPQVHDPTMQVEYQHKSGVGARFSWTSRDGNGNLVITKAYPDTLINIETRHDESDSTKRYYKLKHRNDTTMLTTRFDLKKNFTNPISRLLAFIFITPKLNKAINFELDKIKEITEARPVFTITITEESLAPTYYISVSRKMSSTIPEKIVAQMKDMFGEVRAVMENSKAESIDKPFCLIDISSEKRICAMPIHPDSKFPPEYPVSQHYSGAAIRGVHMGSYETIKTTHEQVMQYIEYKKFELNGMPWEIYVNNPGNTFDSNELVVEVYYPVK